MEPEVVQELTHINQRVATVEGSVAEIKKDQKDIKEIYASWREYLKQDLSLKPLLPNTPQAIIKEPPGIFFSFHKKFKPSHHF